MNEGLGGGFAGRAPGWRRPRWLGCLGWTLGGVVAIVALIIGIGMAFDQGERARQPARVYNAGSADNFETPSVHHFSAQHMFVVRMPDGSFIALYDRSPRQQELGGSCRVRFDRNASIGSLSPVPGIRGALVEDCEGARTVWRADGAFAFGAGYPDVPLDTLSTSINDAGELVVDLSQRLCTRSRGVAGVPPFDRERCGPPT